MTGRARSFFPGGLHHSILVFYLFRSVNTKCKAYQNGQTRLIGLGYLKLLSFEWGQFDPPFIFQEELIQY